MKILLDNVIFSLQKAGGISIVWQQHLKRIINDIDFECSFFEYKDAEYNFFRSQIFLDQDSLDIKNNFLLKIKRYLNLHSKISDKHIFHSSYYRTDKRESAINVTTVHDFTYEYFFNGFSKNIHSYQKKKSILNSDGIICVSENTKRDLLKFIPNINENKIRVIYNGVDDVYRPLFDLSNFEKKHFFEDYNYVLYVGDRKAGYKNFHIAVEVCSLSKMSLLIIGGGELSIKEIHFLNEKLGDANFVSLLNVDSKDLNYYYNKAFCLLYPSLYEGFGIPIIEAQRAGCPVIATNSSSIQEIIGNKSLLIYNPTPQKIVNKMKELKINGSYRTEMIEQGFYKSKDLSWQKTYDETKKFYSDLFNS
jgi:glycosyltransferase involved in cell wall biosynthesis